MTMPTPDARIPHANRPYGPYAVIVLGFVLFVAGLAVDAAQHGLDFLVNEFRESPWAHGLPLIGIVLVMVGVALAWRHTGRTP